MPEQMQNKSKKQSKLAEQVFSEERTAQVQVLEKNATIVNNQAAILLQQKMRKKRKAKAEAEAKRAKMKKKEWFDLQLID